MHARVPPVHSLSEGKGRGEEEACRGRGGNGRALSDPPSPPGGLPILGLQGGDFPVAERVSREVLSLPIFPELSDDEVRYVAERLVEAVGA